MDDFIKYNKLFDCYESLLTEKEKAVFKDYYGDDLSLKEIADNKKVSRSAVHKTIKVVEEKLDYYENNLKLCKILDSINTFPESNSISKLKEDIRKIIEG